MGLFASKSGYQKEDLMVAFESAKTLVDWWNGEHCDMFGFKLEVAVPNLEECCRIGADLFDQHPHYFARPPGPFKRVAAFLVLGCLEPFLGFVEHPRPPARRLALPASDYEARVWHVRFMLMALPQLFSRLHVKLDGKWEKITWHGLPSQHFQLEFMNWLKWLDHHKELMEALSEKIDWKGFQKKRLARMVMATALSLEASYYATPEGSRLLGKTHSCMSKLSAEQTEDLFFHLLPGN